ncbi:AC5 [Papaya leaf curl Lucknow virus 2]|uniref:AC5 n=1 Tax=Papaya leaf curl Lucknow virus 2 TaxID=3232064 RepID=A0A5P1I959_9GEMI|nr:AC5 [Papaya severe leaf curl virus]QBP05527.1 AC5 [Papaya severe leaf curl virus]
MILIFASLLLVVHNIIINPNKLLHESLLLRCILTPCHSCMPLPEHLVPIPMHIFHRHRAGLIIKHVKNLTKILRLVNWSTVTNEKEHHIVRVILGLYIFIHPYFTQHINRLHTKPLRYSMGQPNTPSNITKTNGLTHVIKIMSASKGLDLNWTFPAPRDIWTSVHPGHPGLSVHGPVRPCFCFGDADNGGSSTAHIWAVEVETATYLRCGR